MRSFRHLLGFSIALLVISAAAGAFAQPPAVAETAGDLSVKLNTEIDLGVCAFESKDYVGAQHHFEAALALEPKNTEIPSYIARSAYRQYKAGSDVPVNTAKAQAAIDAYERVLAIKPADPEAIEIILTLREVINPGNLPELASREDLSRAMRAHAYLMLAKQSVECSKLVTDNDRYRRTVTVGGKTMYKYVRPANSAEFEKAMRCVVQGLEYIDPAVKLLPDDEMLLSYRAELLYEKTHLAEMEGDPKKKAEYENSATIAKAVYKASADKAREIQRLKDEEETKRPESKPDVELASMQRFIVTGKL